MPRAPQRSGSSDYPPSCLPSYTLQRSPHPSPGCDPAPRASATSWHYTACTLPSPCPLPCKWGLLSAYNCRNYGQARMSDCSCNCNCSDCNSGMYNRPRYTSRCNTMCACCDRVPTLIASSYRRNGSRCRAGCRPRYTSQMTSSSSCNYDPTRIPSYRLTSPSRSGCRLCARRYPMRCTSRRYQRIRGYDPKPHRQSAS